VNDLQELSKLEAGYLPIQAESFALCPLLTTLVDHFGEQFVNQDGVAIVLDCPSSLSPVYADSIRVEQIMINLLGNALRYTPARQGYRAGLGVNQSEYMLSRRRYWHWYRSSITYLISLSDSGGESNRVTVALGVLALV
jgi:signal transduction histidine kinase